VDLGRFFSFLIYKQSAGLLGRGISPSQGRYIHTEQHKQNKRTQTSMPHVGFEPTIPVFERAKTVHALHRAATVIGSARGIITSNHFSACPLRNITEFRASSRVFWHGLGNGKKKGGTTFGGSLKTVVREQNTFIQI
jgi:hypothetical protein